MRRIVALVSLLACCGDDRDPERADAGPADDARIADARPLDAMPRPLDAAPDPFAGDAYVGPVDPGCARFALRFSTAREHYVEEEVQCTCPQLKAPLHVGWRCSYGHCIVRHDCTELCEHAVEQDRLGSDDPEVRAFLEDTLAFSRCITTFECTRDEDCGDNVCASSFGGAPRTCAPGVGQCNVDADCLSGRCVLSQCRTGAPGSWCEQARDCAEGMSCTNLFSNVGGCTTGGPGEPCGTSSDCKAGNCIQSFSASQPPYGQCARAAMEPDCSGDADCPGGYCAGMYCGDGLAGAPCKHSGQCKASLCKTDFINVGVCEGRGLGAWCDRDEHCDSGRCTRWGEAFAGICTNGERAAPCEQNDDCKLGLLCRGPLVQAMVGCQELGAPCGRNGEGTCDGARCRFARCE